MPQQQLAPTPLHGQQGQDRIDPLSQLLVQAQNGDSSASQRLVTAISPGLVGWLRKRLGNREDAEDVGQETLQRVFRGRFDPTKGSARNWIFRIAGNESVSLLRRRNSRPCQALADHEPVAPVGDPAEALAAQETFAAIEQARATLPASEAVTIQLRLIDGLSHGELLQRLQIPSGTAASRYSRALAKLRRRLSSP